MSFAPLTSSGSRLTGRIFASLLFLTLFAAHPASARPQSGDGSANPIPVLVSDFELYSVPPPPSSPQTQSVPKSQQTPKALPAPEDAELPSMQARRLVDFFAATLVDALKKNGYTVRRTRGQQLSKGALLRGVFAEPDEKNRIRRTLLGGTSANPKFFLYVGIFNLARPDQPLYQLAEEQPGGSQFGPVITLNNYIPLAKYELDKNPSDEDVRKVCAQIAASLTALLDANPDAFSQ